MADFYVYLHRRRDDGAVFYVGKGSGYRATVMQRRNALWCATRDAAGGVLVEYAATGLDEDLAGLVEAELIAKLKRAGVSLANMTSGGCGGMSGFKFAAASIEARAAKQRGQRRPSVSAALSGKPKSAEHRLKLSVAKLGKRPRGETREKMSQRRRGIPVPMLCCLKCGAEVSILNAGRWHLGACRKG